MNILDEFKSFLSQNLPSAPSFHPHYEKALRTMLLAGGKHFRAQLLLGVVHAIKPELFPSAMRIALGIEMLHTYSLIHDDLPSMDNADFRRCVPTLHKTYDEVTAILVGDALNTGAFLEIANSNLNSDIKIACVKTLAENGGITGMVLGQAIDCYFEGKALNLKELEFLHIHKTAKLIAASLKMGAIISGLDDTNCENIYQIGIKLGLLFQIQDDLIDATSNKESAGKPVGNDSFKNSFTNLLGINGAKKAKSNQIDEIYSDMALLPKEIAELIKKLINKYLKD